MDNLLISALSAVDVRDLSYAEWMNVGMALKHEGYACSVWDEWSRNDQRYHPGECARKWNTFHGSGTPVTGATIVQMAKQRGWKPFEGSGIMDWNDELSYDGTPKISVPSGRVHDGTSGISVPFDNLLPDMNPTAELAKYISTLFRPEEYVGYVTGEVRQNEDGEWEPLRGVFNRTAGELLTSLAKYPDDLGATIGDWKPQVGGWIRFNPLDGTGASDRNVTAFRYALVESDVIPIQEQLAAYQRLELPIACLVSSGGKSVHAIVHIDAPDESEYRKRVLYLYSFLIGHGLIVDQANKNPSRLSRMPGVDRNGNRQKLLAVNTGRRSWQDWMDFVEGLEDDLPPLEDMSALLAHQPELPEELIRGILRCGHKMLISGSSKAGKSFLLMELAIAIAEGRKWLGFPCKKGRVLYVKISAPAASTALRKSTKPCTFKSPTPQTSCCGTCAARLCRWTSWCPGSCAVCAISTLTPSSSTPSTRSSPAMRTRLPTWHCSAISSTKSVPRPGVPPSTVIITPRAIRATRMPKTVRPAPVCLPVTPMRSWT